MKSVLEGSTSFRSYHDACVDCGKGLEVYKILIFFKEQTVFLEHIYMFIISLLFKARECINLDLGL